MKTMTWTRGAIAGLAILAGLLWVNSSPADELNLSQPAELPRHSTAAWSGHFSLALGVKQFDETWAPDRDRFAFGADMDLTPPGWPLSFAAQFLGTVNGDVPNQPNFRGEHSDAYEINFGLRKIWRVSSWFQPFVNGGMSMIHASTSTDVDTGEVDEDGNEIITSVTEGSDTGVGYWVGGGFYVNCSEHFHIGVEAQYSSAEVELFGNNMDAGGVSVMVTAGWHW